MGNRFGPHNLYRVGGILGQRLGCQVYWRLKKREGDFAFRIVDSLVHKGDTVVDVGAAWGLYSWRLAELVGRSGHVYLFEPHPVHVRCLESLCGSCPNLTIYSLALSDRAGQSTLYVPIRRGWPSYTRAALAIAPELSTTPHVSVEVRLERLDRLLGSAASPISFIKCDVEGHELAVLRGADATLRRWKPTLLVEVEQRHQNSPIQETFDHLQALGYVGYAIRSTGIRPLAEFDIYRDQVSQLGWRGKAPPTYVHDFLFVQPDLGVKHLLAPS